MLTISTSKVASVSTQSSSRTLLSNPDERQGLLTLESPPRKPQTLSQCVIRGSSSREAICFRRKMTFKNYCLLFQRLSKIPAIRLWYRLQTIGRFADSRVYPGRRHRGGPGCVLLAPIQIWRRGYQSSSVRLEFPVRGSVYSRWRTRKYIGLSRGGIGQEASQRDELLLAVAGSGRPPREPLRHAAWWHTRIPRWVRVHPELF